MSTGSDATCPEWPFGDGATLGPLEPDDGDDDGSFMSEAGVAGEGMAARGSGAGAGFETESRFPLAACFPLLALGGGSGGGGISDNASGETELLSSISSRLRLVTLGLHVRLDDSTASLSTWLAIVVLAVFRRCGFVMGDWRTLVFLGPFEVLVFLAFLATS